jgi:hypothetical protein
MSLIDATRALKQAFEVPVTTRVHLCPVDGLLEFSCVRLARGKLGKFSREELYHLFGGDAAARKFSTFTADLRRLSMFHWLVVREKVSLPENPAFRAAPILMMDGTEEFGAIEPHRRRYPEAVEMALFHLLLAPWEDWTHGEQPDWRAFDVPWVYSHDDDPFVSRQSIPDPDTLTWVPVALMTASGELIEEDRPVEYDLMGDPAVLWADWQCPSAETVDQALSSPVFANPSAHFFVRALLSDGIDEFLSHLLAIEAALGAPRDTKRAYSDGSSIGGTQCVAFRVSGLLNDRRSGQVYKRLFKLRSAYLHGRALGQIHRADRILARGLARRTLYALTIGAAGIKSRGLALRRLLEKGMSL